MINDILLRQTEELSCQSIVEPLLLDHNLLHKGDLLWIACQVTMIDGRAPCFPSPNEKSFEHLNFDGKGLQAYFKNSHYQPKQISQFIKHFHSKVADNYYSLGLFSGVKLKNGNWLIFK